LTPEVKKRGCKKSKMERNESIEIKKRLSDEEHTGNTFSILSRVYSAKGEVHLGL
jgi:hypothetical protein